MKKYDFIIVGGGAAGFAAAIRANELKAKTAFINSGLPLGGTCVNVGCVPSKKLLWAGEVMHLAKNHGIPGIDIEVKNFDFNKVVRDELDLVEKLQEEKYKKVLKNLEHIHYIEGKARFVLENEIEVNGQTLQADKFLIATGSTARSLPIKGPKEIGYITHIEALKLKKQPKELAVIGGGPLGLEFAQMYARFGTYVTLLEAGSRIMAHSEVELTDRLTQILEGENISIKTNALAKSVKKEGDKKVLTYSAGDKEEKISVDEILLAAGKIPNTDGLNLEKAGVKVNEKNAVVINEKMQASPHIYAAGDVAAAPLRLETTAGREGSIAAENALNGGNESLDYHTVPYTVFTDPQLAGVGFTEETQQKETGVCACRTVSFEQLPKAHIIGRTEGLIKMGVDPKTQEILGVHILAPNASELIAEAMMLVKNKNTLDDVIKSAPMFPTLSEAIKLVALSFTKDVSKLSCCV